MSRTGTWSLFGLFAACGALLPLAGAQAEDRPRDRAKDRRKPAAGARLPDRQAIIVAGQAYQLALEAQQRRSPILMLAAIELLGSLKEARGRLKDVKAESRGGKGADREVATDLKAMIELAREYARDDKDLGAFLEKKLEALSGRGLIYVQGRDLRSETIADGKFKVIDARILASGRARILSNVLFEADKPALLLLVKERGSYVEMVVTDGRTGRPVGAKTTGPGGSLVVWKPRSQNPTKVVVGNPGRTPAKFVLLANWDF